MTIKRNSQGEALKAAEIGAFVTLRKIEPAGSLQARKLKNGAVALYWRYTFDGTTERMLIGTYDATRPPKSVAPDEGRYSFAAATHAAQALATKHFLARKSGGLRALVADEKAHDAKARATQIQARVHTFERLLLAYCDYLESIGRNAHREARNILTLHVIKAWPNVASTPASDVTDEQVADMLRRLFELGKGRTANKLRAYIRAAYEVARKARTDPKVPVAFKAFNVRFNPAAATAASPEANRPDKNPLSANEMRLYWKLIRALPGKKGAVLRLHLLTGGQRIEQLVRLKTADVADQSIMLFDGKGRPGKAPRPHPIPLIPVAAQTLHLIEPSGEYAISTDGGTTHIAGTTLSQWATEAAASIKGFKTKRLRSGIETLLASAGISKDFRSRLQSHGISGVQAAHYDAHDYLPEKLLALQALFKLLNATELPNSLITNTGEAVENC